MAPRSKSKEKVKDYLRQYLPLLEIVKGLTPKQARAIIPHLSSDSHDAFCLCVHNAVCNYEKLPNVNELHDLMVADEKKYRYLSDKRYTKSDKVFTQRADILEQTGEGLPLILTSVLPLLVNLLTPK